MTDFALATRPGLPDALRLLLPLYPRDGWTRHHNFDGLVAFWLDRHLSFRDLTARMAQGTQALLDRSIDPADFAATLLRLGTHFLNDLHGHHGIEDAYFFPRLTLIEPRLAQGFAMLETDHQSIDGVLHRFANAANSLLPDPANLTHAAAFAAELAAVTALLDRHLTDEEDLIVPVILHVGPGALD